MPMPILSCVRFPALVAATLSMLLAIVAPAQVTTSVVADKAEVKAGDRVTLAVVWEFTDGYHIHTNDPKPPKEWDFTAIPTTITVTPGTSFVVGPVQWPKTKIIQADLSGMGQPKPYEVFGGDRVIAFVPAMVAADATGEVKFDLVLRYQACNDEVCLRPAKEPYTITLPVAAASKPAEDAAFFSGFDSKTFDGDWTKPGTATVPPTPTPAGETTQRTPQANASTTTPPTTPTTSSPAVPRTFFGIPIPQGGFFGIIVILLLAILGGLILNLTPCVLPVIPLKIITLTQHAGSQGRTVFLGTWMAIGVVAFWVGIGIPVLLFSSFGDPSRIFSIWWVTAGLGVLIALMSLGLMGLFNLNLPQGLYMINPKADTAWGSFLFGVMTAVLGLPCFGFVAGALLGAAATLPKIATLSIFLGLGIGMALPYLVLAFFPKLVHRIPRTGPASELVKQVMGLLMLAAAAYFIGSGLIALVASKPWLGKQLHIWLVAGFGIAASVWLVVRTVKITPSTARRAVFTLVGLFIAGMGVWYASDATTRAKNTYIARAAAMEAAGGGKLLTGTWIDYNPGLFEQARKENKIIVMDFTAEWCLICKTYKATILEREPVKGAFNADDVVLFTVDLTAETAPGWKTLNDFGETGIPLLVIYTPGKDTPWKSNTYTSDLVMAEIAAARNAAATLTQAPATAPKVAPAKQGA
ncbi:MAG TPA: cytochrome c biogenesis protein CcdA [Phycisphaerales bacterium]|nr:cytochrome c biogenesis protein CcdA [Phycisphaerales bacterium]